MTDAGLQWLAGAGKGRREVRVLFTSAGRRVELMQAFTRAAAALKIKGLWHTADIERLVAASCLAARTHDVPPNHSAEYVPALLEIVRRQKIDLLIPLIDSDLLPIARSRRQFAELRCGALISAPEVIETCRDKLKTFKFLLDNGIDTPETWQAGEVAKRRKHRFPYFLKPRSGSASKGSFIIKDRNDLETLLPRVPDAIVQEFVPGIEYTLDVYTGFDGLPRCVVPRQRIEVRGGEVTRARTVRNPRIIAVGKQVAQALQHCVGLVTIQLILAPDQRIRVIEVNPRFGGGVPLGIQAGADFPRWILAQWLGRQPRIKLDGFEDGLLMLRYHQSFFLKRQTGPLS